MLSVVVDACCCRCCCSLLRWLSLLLVCGCRCVLFVVGVGVADCRVSLMLAVPLVCCCLLCGCIAYCLLSVFVRCSLSGVVDAY